jgi:hypothetical protein
MRLSTRKHIKRAAQWAALSILAVALVVAASLIGAELAGEPNQAGWALAKLAGLGTFVLCLVGWVCNSIED